MLELKRTKYDDRTETRAYMPDGREMFFLERPDKDNKPFVSCIPDGRYVADKDHTGKFTYYRLKDVPNRSHIEIHPAHTVDQLEGCIAPCWKIVGGKAYQSTSACIHLVTLFGESSIALNITTEADHRTKA